MDFLKGKKWILQFQANNDLSVYNMKERNGRNFLTRNRRLCKLIFSKPTVERFSFLEFPMEAYLTQGCWVVSGHLMGYN